ncbi:mycothiol system anti-sigma-R factor [Yinghuangia soli]|jgi:mycothiol system anti-sigma-R factor|uniref:Mycothiol system anti-sigma-R factor n=1 Tax=Yinghuangia soli TaxID=2908204 RepID=A0AA41Q1P0_9ACTN|nr:mycothiol system anti-sigma-R factor [Yinghuangia soli]MCF2529930.1 mycothiol system anti-sigma-R factor [Yinghuangia soli]
MSCGDHHEVDCSQILDRLYEYIDNELADADCGDIRTHLDECSPCLEKYGLEQHVKALVQRCCGCDDVPVDLRSKVLARIREVKVQVETDGSGTHVRVEEVTVEQVAVERPGA